MPIAARTGTPCLPQVEEAITSSGMLCSGQAGSKFWQVATPLTDFQLTTVCLTGTCLNLVKELQKIAGTDECVTTDGFYLYQDVLNPVLKQCGEAKVEPPTLPPSSSSGGKSATSSASSRHTRVATLVVAVLGVAQLVLV